MQNNYHFLTYTIPTLPSSLFHQTSDIISLLTPPSIMYDRYQSLMFFCGSYSEDIVKMVMEHTDKFYIRAERHAGLYEKVKRLTKCQWDR